MNGLFRASCSSILSGSARFVAKRYFSLYPAVRTVNLCSFFTKPRVVWWYSSKKTGGAAVSRKVEFDSRLLIMKDDTEEFFVVRKGSLVGVYKSLSDCQDQVGTSIRDPPVSVYKGYSMPKDTESHLLSCGLKNALYSIRASDLTPDLLGTIVSCPVLPPPSKGEPSKEPVTKKGEPEAVRSGYGQSCTLEFDGASKGNPGQAGAGAILRSDDGSLICRLREGLGIATNNAAEYRALILGLRYALEKGFTNVLVRGDSMLVCMQIQGSWKVKNPNISSLYEEARKLKDRFASFQILHVLRDLNSEADTQANLAVDLAEGRVMVDSDK